MNSTLSDPLLSNISNTRGEIHNKILKNSESLQSLSKEEVYNPFQQPASFFKADLHRQSRKIGIARSENVCQCCNNYIDKKPIDLSCVEKELVFLGSGYPLFFRLTKYFGLIIFIQVIISIFFTYFINFVCEEKCVRFFNIPIIDIAHIDKKMGKQAIQNACVAFCMSLVLIYIKPMIFYNIQEYNDRFVNPSKYTIQVKNIPTDATKQEIIEFFEKETNEKIMKINMAYDIEDYTEAFQDKIDKLRQLKELEFQLEDLNHQLTDDQVNNIENEIKEIKNCLLLRDQQLYEFQQECRNAKTSSFTGTVFISFQTQKPAKSLVKNWGVSTWREIKFLFLNVALSSPYLQFGGRSLIITQAFPPTDIVWQNLRYQKIRSMMNNTILFFGGLGLLVGSFLIQFWVMKYVYPMKKQTLYVANDYYLKFQALLMSIVVITINALLRQLVQRFAQLMKFDSVTKSYSAYINRYIVLYFANSAFLPYLVHARFDSEDETRELLIQDVHFILLASAFSTPLGKIFDMTYFYKIYQRRYLSQYTEIRNPYTQHEANQIMEDYTINIVNSYTFITITLFVSAWYGSVAPVGIVFSLLGLILNYWVDKFQLLRIQAQPEGLNEKVIKKVINVLEILPIVYLAGNYVYEFRITISQNLPKFFMDFVGYGLTQIILSLSFLLFFFCYRKKIPKQGLNQHTYDQVRAFFRTEYDACNPITQQEAQLEWIQFLRRKHLITKPEKQILLQQNQKISQLNCFPIQNTISNNFDIRNIAPQRSFIDSFKQPSIIQENEQYIDQPFPTEQYEMQEFTEEDLPKEDSSEIQKEMIEYKNFEIDDYHKFRFQESDEDDYNEIYKDKMKNDQDFSPNEGNLNILIQEQQIQSELQRQDSVGKKIQKQLLLQFREHKFDEDRLSNFSKNSKK